MSRKYRRIKMGFTGCGKTRSGGRRGFQPPHKANRINAGSSPGRALYVDFAPSIEFFRSLFSPSGRTVGTSAKLRTFSAASLAPEDHSIEPSFRNTIKGSAALSKRIGKSLSNAGTTIVSESEWNAELDAKHEQLVKWLRAQGLAGILIRRNENVAWLTGGAVELRVLTPCETGVASLLVTTAGKRYYFTTENEAPRLHDEEFGALDFEPVLFPWWADDTNAAAAKLAPLGSDTPCPGMKLVNLAPLRAALCDTEIARYRWLGAETAAATVEALNKVEPGMTEYDLEAITAAALLRRGILPSVYLFAADDRILKYKHAVARGNRLQQYAMLNLCSRKWGLAI